MKILLDRIKIFWYFKNRWKQITNYKVTYCIINPYLKEVTQISKTFDHNELNPHLT